MASSSRAYPLRSRLVSGLFLSLLLLPCAWLSVSQAQVTTAIRPDGTLGTRVRQHGTVYTIRGGTWPERGPNLFHSFDRFSVGTGDTVRFSAPPGTARIENILSRVTGGSSR
jgi:large exoprotein involved in heme utilization and adhesion